MDLVAGWFGKLPALGDFATRRLAPDFVEPWDHWLAEGLAAWRADDADWLEGYLAGPVWRFVAAPGVLGGRAAAQSWAGVLMPSMDRVGRYFPLTVAAALPPSAGAHAAMLVQWMRQAGELAASALRDDWNAEQVDHELQQLAETTVVSDNVDDELTSLVAASIGAHGHVLWWRGVDDGSIELQRSHGLPAGEAFRRLLSGLAMSAEQS